ncbi:carbohydrate ABC transporter permease [Paenibacillus sp. URB8-2]|uniref:carbohydrate ABC transporter permease n=1 Tax=Paenibacillus sp. URB8-2 TaxID=2741301 RepID=UPI0015C24399|nr:sugar ABC transporter permease [Paenibacillus sp. URB8-2]BCG60955.1 lactose ABC transporter permease [Paenibacillus sp. URB8-2]
MNITPETETTRALNQGNPIQKRARLKWIHVVPYVFILPYFALFSVFILYPILYSLMLSFSQWNSSGLTFIGLTNYKNILTNPLFWKSLSNTGQILIIQVPIMLSLATVVAVFINSSLIRFRTFFRLGFFLPVLIDLVTYSLVFSLMFNENFGLINHLLSLFGGHVAWRTDPFWAKVMIIVAITWRWTGYNSIIVLSGLQSIPKDLYESASIDGAGRIISFFKITVPMLKPVLLFCTIISTIGTLQLFVEPYVLTRGGPSNATMTAMYYLYDIAFGTFNFGLASAGAYLVTIVIAILSYLQIRIGKGGEI